MAGRNVASNVLAYLRSTGLGNAGSNPPQMVISSPSLTILNRHTDTSPAPYLSTAQTR